MALSRVTFILTSCNNILTENIKHLKFKWKYPKYPLFSVMFQVGVL